MPPNEQIESRSAAPNICCLPLIIIIIIIVIRRRYYFQPSNSGFQLVQNVSLPSSMFDNHLNHEPVSDVLPLKPEYLYDQIHFSVSCICM